MVLRATAEGFGFIPLEAEHHFLVTIPKERDASISISEYFTCEERWRHCDIYNDKNIRVLLTRQQWEAIADVTRAEFNRRLKTFQIKASRWQTGQTPLARIFGKELVLLAWGIEDADLACIPLAIKTWQKFAPEERWWLYTMTSSVTGHALLGRNRGWRKAIRYILTENVIPDDIPAQLHTPFAQIALEKHLRSDRVKYHVSYSGARKD